MSRARPQTTATMMKTTFATSRPYGTFPTIAVLQIQVWIRRWILGAYISYFTVVGHTSCLALGRFFLPVRLGFTFSRPPSCSLFCAWYPTSELLSCALTKHDHLPLALILVFIPGSVVPSGTANASMTVTVVTKGYGTGPCLIQYFSSYCCLVIMSVPGFFVVSLLIVGLGRFALFLSTCLNP